MRSVAMNTRKSEGAHVKTGTGREAVVVYREKEWVPQNHCGRIQAAPRQKGRWDGKRQW
jgi:hypothetical protein